MNYSLLAPEMLIALTGLLLLISGLILAGRGQRLVGIISVVLLVAVLLLVVVRFSESAVFFNGVYQVDTFANFFKALFLIAAVLVMLSAGKYTQRFEQKQSEFYALMVFATLGMMVMAAAGDLITIYIGLELMTVSFYILTAYLLNDEASSEAGLKYLILGAISSAILLFGMSLLFALSGTTVISEIAGKLSRQPALIAGIILMIVGFGFIRLGIDTWHLVDELYEQGFRGLKTISPRKNYSDKEYYSIYKRAEELNMPILFHTGIKIFNPLDVKHDVACERMQPIFLDAIARAFPKLKIIGAHLGVPWYNEACMVARANPNVFFDLSGAINLLYELKPWFFETLTYWEMAKEKFVFGVDDHYERIPEAVNKFNILMDKLNFSQELREKIFYGNMEKILGL